MQIIKIDSSKKTYNLKVKESEDIFLLGQVGGEVEVVIALETEGTSAQLYGLLLGTGDAHYKVVTKTKHIAPNTSSRVHLKGVFTGKSILDYEGMIEIGKDAQLADAYLQNDNLVLSDDCLINSSPQLEITADDVKASHGVTITSIDDYERYYLESRGLGLRDAESLIISGFINELFEHVEDPVEMKSLINLTPYGS